MALVAFLSLGSYSHAMKLMDILKSEDPDSCIRQVAAAARLTSTLPAAYFELKRVRDLSDECQTELLSDPCRNPFMIVDNIEPLLRKVLRDLKRLKTPERDELETASSGDEAGISKNYISDGRVEIVHHDLATFLGLPRTIFDKELFRKGLRIALKSLKTLIEFPETSIQEEEAAAAADPQVQKTANCSQEASEVVWKLKQFSCFFSNIGGEINNITNFLKNEQPTGEEWNDAKRLIGLNPEENQRESLEALLNERLENALTLNSIFYDLYVGPQKNYLPTVVGILSGEQTVAVDKKITPELRSYRDSFINLEPVFGASVPHKGPEGQYRVPTETDIRQYGVKLSEKILDLQEIKLFFRDVQDAVSEKIHGLTPISEKAKLLSVSIRYYKSSLFMMEKEVAKVIECFNRELVGIVDGSLTSASDELTTIQKQISNDREILTSKRETEYLTITLQIQSGEYQAKFSRMKKRLEFYKHRIGRNHFQEHKMIPRFADIDSDEDRFEEEEEEDC